MQGSEERPLGGSKRFNFGEFPTDLDSSEPSPASNSRPLPRNERPLGGKPNLFESEFPRSDLPAEEAENEDSAPLEKRIDSKAWKTRAKAYDEVYSQLKSDSSSLHLYAQSLPKFISDAHPMAQEKGLEILTYFLEKNPDIALPHNLDLVKSLVEKGVTSTKASIKQSSLNLLAELLSSQKEKYDDFIQGLVESLSNKNVKTQAAGIAAVCFLMSAFGVRIVAFQPFMPYIEKFAGGSNAAVRSEALNFYKECYRWVRELVLPSVQQLKKAQQDELIKAFEEIKDPPEPTKTMKLKKLQAKNAGPFKLDIYEMAEPRDIFQKFNEEWANKVLEMEKWNDKKQALEQVNAEANYPKLAGKNPTVLVDLAKKLINDANVNVMVQALKLVGFLSKGMRKNFEPYSRQFFSIFLGKFKEKKTLVIQEVGLGLENLLYSLSLDQVLDEIEEALDDKATALKVNFSQWLQKVFSNLPPEQLLKSAKVIAGMVKKYTDDSTASIRNESFKLLQIMLKRFPDQIGPVIKDFPAAKLKKFEDFDGKKEEPEEEEVKLTKVGSFGATERLKEEKDKEKTDHKNERHNSTGHGPGPPAQVTPSGSKPKPTLKKSATKINDPEPKPAKSKQPTVDIRIISCGDKEKRLDADSRYKWSVDEIRPDYLEKLQEQIKQAFSPDLSALLFNSDFKKQATAAGHLTAIVSSDEYNLVEYLDLVLKWSWIELIISSNTQIYKAVLELNLLIISKLEQLNYCVTDTEAGLILPVLCDKSGNNNAAFRTMIRNIIHSYCKIYSVEKVFTTVVNGVNSKNARSKVECIEEMGSIIKDYGNSFVQPKDVNFIAKQVNSADNNIRAAAVNTLGEVFKLMGDHAWDWIGDMPDKVKGILEQRFKPKADSKKPPEKQPKKEEEKKKEKPSLKTTEPVSKIKKNFESRSPTGSMNAPKEFKLQLYESNEEPNMNKLTEKLHSLEKDKNAMMSAHEKVTSPRRESRDMNKRFNKLAEAKVKAQDTSDPEPQESEKPAKKQKPLKYDVLSLISKLNSSDMLKQQESIVILNEFIFGNLEKYGNEILKNLSALCRTIVYVTPRIFSAKQISFSFGQYFFKIVNKTCSESFIIEKLTEFELLHLCEEFVKALSLERLENLRQKSEIESLLKLVNESLVKVMEFTQLDSILNIMLKLLISYKSGSGKTTEVLVKCLLKSAKKITPDADINFEMLLLNVHEYLIKGETHELGLKIMKTLVNEIIKSTGDSIMKHYTIIDQHYIEDKIIYKWIEEILDRPVSHSTELSSKEEIVEILHVEKNFKSDTPQFDVECEAFENTETENPEEKNIPEISVTRWETVEIEDEKKPKKIKKYVEVTTESLTEIVEKLKNPDQVFQGSYELYSFIENNPEIDVNDEISELPESTQEQVIELLTSFSAKKAPVPRPDSSEMHNRIAVMKMKYSLAGEVPSSLDLNSKVNSLVESVEASKLEQLKNKYHRHSKN